MCTKVLNTRCKNGAIFGVENIFGISNIISVKMAQFLELKIFLGISDMISVKMAQFLELKIFLAYLTYKV